MGIMMTNRKPKSRDQKNHFSLLAISVAVASSFVVFVGALAHASSLEESDLKTREKIDDSGVSKMRTQVEDAALGSEIESNVTEADRAAAVQAKEDEKRLKDELLVIKKKKKEHESEKERAKAEAAAALKKFEQQSSLNQQARGELEAARKAKEIEVQKTAAVQAELKAVEDESRALAEEQRQVDIHTQMAKSERDEAVKRMSDLRAQILATRQKQQAQNQRIEVYRRKTREFVEREDAKSRSLAAQGQQR